MKHFSQKDWDLFLKGPGAWDSVKKRKCLGVSEMCEGHVVGEISKRFCDACRRNNETPYIGLSPIIAKKRRKRFINRDFNN